MARSWDDVQLPDLGRSATAFRSKKDSLGVSRQGSLKDRADRDRQMEAARSPRFKIACPVKLPSLGRSPRTSRTPRESLTARERTSSKESQPRSLRQSSLEPRAMPKRSLASTLGYGWSPKQHSASMLSTDSTDASPHISYDPLRLSESMPRGSTSPERSESSSSEERPSAEERLERDVEDVDRSSFSLEGIPDLELIRASPVPEAAADDTRRSSAEACSSQSLQLPQASRSHVPTRAWGSTSILDEDRSQSSSPSSPLKSRRSYRRCHTTPADTGCIGRPIKSLEGQKIYDMYYWEEVIQEDGDGGKVVVCRKKTEDNTGEFDKVMKIKSKLKLQKEGFAEHYRTVLSKMLSLPPHPGVMPVEEALEDDAFYYVVTPRATSSFFDGLLVDFHDGVVPESALRSLMTDMLEAVEHLHNYGVLHRDIKPDNMVLQTYVDESGAKRRRVVLIDFDHADPDFHQGTEDQERIYGTRRFNAPESYLCSFTRQTDLYSIGVIFYMLMTGKMPYDDEMFDGIKPPGSRMVSPRALLQDTFQRLREADIDWYCDPWPMQPVSMDLCKQLLAFNPALRPACARSALSHAWFSD